MNPHYIIDYAFACAMLTLLAICFAVWIGQAILYHRRLRNIQRESHRYGHPAFFIPSRRWPTE